MGLFLALSADGKTVASGSGDKTVKVWSAATGKELLTLSGHAEEVRSVALSADGKTLASGSADETVKDGTWPRDRASDASDPSA